VDQSAFLKTITVDVLQWQCNIHRFFI